MLAYDLSVVFWVRTGKLNFWVMGNDRLKRIEVVLVDVRLAALVKAAAG